MSCAPLSAATLGSLFALVGSAASGCGADAVGIEDCRQIEQARCDTGAACGLVKDIDACKRFYRDHCLHGLALEGSPGSAQVKACVTALTTAAECARTRGPLVPTDKCDPGIGLTNVATPCDLVSKPEQTEPCRFLVPDTPPPTIDAGSDSGENDAATE
jgi:hypothetical protein